MSVNTLVLYPSDPYAVPYNIEAFADQLRQIGFIGDSFDLHGTLRYRQGRDFLNLIDFQYSHDIIIMENSPEGGLIEGQKIDSRQRCDIWFDGPWDSPKIICGVYLKPPYCHSCRRQASDPEMHEMLNTWHIDKERFRWQCPSCQQICKIHELDWQHRAGFGQFAIQIQSIYPGEAYPNQHFLNILTKATATAWTYLFSRL